VSRYSRGEVCAATKSNYKYFFLFIIFYVIPHLGKDMSNPYKQCLFLVLGIQKTATKEEISKRWRKLCLQLHPDKNQSEEASERTKIINDAKERAIEECD
jgi:DnaJ-class molecular chaperone